MHNLYRLLFISVSLVLLTNCNKKTHSLVQTETKPSDTSNQTPSWINMMNDPKVNYYQAVDAFNAYWATRERPTENNGEAKDIFGKEKTTDEKKKEEARSVQYVYEYKQFLNWMERNKNLVKPDGTLMSAEEIMEQSERERKNR